MTLTKFLLARIAEDQAEVDSARHDDETEGEGAPGNFHQSGCYYYSFDLDPARCDCDGWKRREAECEAKRRIIADPLVHNFMDQSQVSLAGQRLLLHLVLPYVEHPDYDEAWALEVTEA